jgi:pimeloyl-ACP methyl ester carboxylesterase
VKSRRHFLLLSVGALLLAAGILYLRSLVPEVEKEIRGEIREFVLTHTPDAGAYIDQHYGIRLYPDGKVGARYPHSGERSVVLVHGLDDPGKVWMNLAPALHEAGYSVLDFQYPNDQPIRSSAELLGESMGSLEAPVGSEIAIVAHSMGGLVSREFLTSPEIGYMAGRDSGRYPKVVILVQVGTPNHGSALARFRLFTEFRDQWQSFFKERGHVLGAVFDGVGEAGIDLIPKSRFLLELNARPHPPDLKIISIAGIASPVSRESAEEAVAKWHQTLPDGAQPAVEKMGELLAGLSDGVGDGAVTLASTRLEGVATHLTVEGTHLSMIRNIDPASTRLPPAVPIVLEQLKGVLVNSGNQ